MLSNEDYKEFDKLVNAEFMTQVDDSGFEAALWGVRLSLALVEEEDSIPKEIFQAATRYLFRFAKWRTLAVSGSLKRNWYVQNYGEEEVQAMERDGELFFA